MSDVSRITDDSGTTYNLKDASARGDITSLDSRVTALEQSGVASSHVGMVIHSTTLDTEAKVKAIYGGTTWIKLSGYVLRGASSNVTPNSNSKDGGNDSVSYTPSGSLSGGSVGSHTLTVDEIPSHTHTQEQHRHLEMPNGYKDSTPGATGHGNGFMVTQSAAALNTYTQYATPTINATGGGQGHSHSFTRPSFSGSASTINTVPNYKNVYIWERTA